MVRARAKYLSPDQQERAESLETLWDAFERLKTVRASNKKKGIASLISDVADEEAFHNLLDVEARTLTDIGNNFRIRHSEIGKVSLESSPQIDYLFGRLYALVHLLLPAEEP